LRLIGINKETTSIKINIMGEEFTLIQNERRQWYAREMAVGGLAELLRVVTKNVVLRYRLELHDYHYALIILQKGRFGF
jgi:hypothetical protein